MNILKAAVTFLIVCVTMDAYANWGGSSRYYDVNRHHNSSWYGGSRGYVYDHYRYSVFENYNRNYSSSYNPGLYMNEVITYGRRTPRYHDTSIFSSTSPVFHYSRVNYPDFSGPQYAMTPRSVLKEIIDIVIPEGYEYYDMCDRLARAGDTARELYVLEMYQQGVFDDDHENIVVQWGNGVGHYEYEDSPYLSYPIMETHWDNSKKPTKCKKRNTGNIASR